MSNRPLHSLVLPPSTLSALTRAGYETVRDLAASTPEQLTVGQWFKLSCIFLTHVKCQDACIPIHASQAVFSATQTVKGPPLTQSAATMVQHSSTQYKSGCQLVDDLLNGGLRRGCVLELSGPPGVCKENLALGMARSYIGNDQGILFVGSFYCM
jgi:RAD51-like protein 2